MLNMSLRYDILSVCVEGCYINVYHIKFNTCIGCQVYDIENGTSPVSTANFYTYTVLHKCGW